MSFAIKLGTFHIFESAQVTPERPNIRRLRFLGPTYGTLSLLNKAWANPLHKVSFCQFAGCETKHGVHRVGWLRPLQFISISLQEFDHRQPRCALIPIG